MTFPARHAGDISARFLLVSEGVILVRNSMKEVSSSDSSHLTDFIAGAEVSTSPQVRSLDGNIFKNLYYSGVPE